MVPTDSSEPTGDDASETRGSATGAIVRLRRVQHPGRIIAFVAVVIVMLAASFVAGAMLVAPEREAVDNATTRVEPTLFVEERVVAAELQLSAGVVAGASYDIVRGPEYLLGAERSVVCPPRAEVSPHTTSVTTAPSDAGVNTNVALPSPARPSAST